MTQMFSLVEAICDSNFFELIAILFWSHRVENLLNNCDLFKFIKRNSAN